MANPFAGTELKESNPFAGTEEKFVGMDANEILAMDVPVPSAPDLYFNQDIINFSFKDAAVEEGKLAQSEFKKVVSSKYLSVLSGANELDIQDNYEAYSSAHGFTGNHEADFQLIGNKFTAGRVNIPDDLDKIKKSDGRIWNSIMQGFLFDGIASLGEAFYRTSKQVVGNVATFEPHARGRQLYLKSQIKDLEKKVEAKYGDDLSVTMADDPDFYALRQAQLENDTITEYFNAKKQNVALFKKLEDWEATTRAYRYFEKEINFPVEEEFGKSFAGEFSKAAGNMVYSLGAFSISGPTGLGSNIGVIYQGAIDDARAHGATEAEAFDAGILELPAGAADAAIDRFLFTKFLKPFSGKMTVGQMSKLIAASTAAGGMSEGAEQAWNNINAKYLSKYDQTRMLDEGVLASIAIGAILGAGVQTTSSGLSYILPSDGKVNSKAPTDEEYNLLSNLYTDEEIYEQGGKLLSNAVKGDPVAREEIRYAVNGNVEDNNSFGISLQATIETEGVLVGDELFEETRGGLDRFHGTSTEITQLEEGAYASQNIFGQGLYTTDAVDVAIGYTKKGNGTQPTLYKIEEIKPNLKFYDMEAPLDNEITKIIDDVLKGTDFYGMQREGDIDGNPIDSLRKLYNEIRAESRELGWTADDVQELFESIKVNLEQAGYDGIEHIGAANSKKYYPHTVKVYFNPQDTVELVKVNPDSFKLYNEPISELAEDVAEEEMSDEVFKRNLILNKIFDFAKKNNISISEKQSGKHITVGFDESGNILFDLDVDKINKFGNAGKLEGSVSELLNEELIHMLHLIEYKKLWDGKGSFIDFVLEKQNQVFKELSQQDPNILVETLRNYADVTDERVNAETVSRIIESFPQDIKDKVIAEAVRYIVSQNKGNKYKGLTSEIISSINNELGLLEALSQPAEAVLGEYEIQPLPDSLSTFEKIAAIAEENIIEVVNKRIGKPKIPSTNSVAEGIEKAGRKLDSWLQKFMSVTTRIGDISKKAKLRVEEMDRQEVILTNEGTRETDPFINSAMKALKVATPEEKLVIKAEMRNGEYDKLEARGIAGIDRMRKFLMNRGNRIPGLSLRENYFPSHVDDYNGLITSLGQEPEGPFSDAIRKAEEKKGGKLTNREKEVVINGVLQTRDNAGVSFLKKRTIETVTPKQMEYYENPLDSLRSYNHRTADFIAKKEFLGQGVFDPYNISGVEKVTVDEDSIQKYILEEIPDLTFNEEKELSKLLKARLQFRRSNKYINAYKTAVALKYVTGFKTVLVQTADLSMITYENALKKSFPNIKDRQQFVDEFGETVDITLDLVGIDVIDQALAEAINTDSLIQKTALFPLKTMDIAMKQGLLNSVSNRWQKQSVSNPEGLKKELMEYFGNEEFVDGIVSDLQNKKVSGDLLLAFYSKISEYHPTGISQHTKFYMDHPNLRPLFVLKSFQFKRLDLIYRRSLKDMLLGMSEATAGAANGSSAEVRAGAARFAEGLANLITILATMYTFETIMEMAYYQFTPRKDDDEYKFTDVYIDNVVNIIPFLSTWDLKNGLNRDNLFKDGLMKAIIPPTPIGAEPATKALGALLLENKTLEWNDLNTELPLVGWWFQEEKDDGRLKRTNRTRPKRGDN